ncbi:MAG: LON peptidase substrate-binding domain-containing protein [Acidobacteriota bacterium]|nr:LON peptidase substrate-binding domain-containing protein [Acidobacteriota bacterium]
MNSIPVRVIPLFPLTGNLLLPGNFLPLNVFEARYRSLVEDVLEHNRLVGLIQPRIPAADNWGPSGPLEENSELYSVGCSGSIEEWERQPDGRYLILLRGRRRFRVLRELQLHRGYRRAEVDFSCFATETEGTRSELDFDRLLASAVAFAARHDLDFDRDLLESLSAKRLLHALCAALPFAAGEKQALLEAEGAENRQSLLLALMEMGLDSSGETGLYDPAVVN